MIFSILTTFSILQRSLEERKAILEEAKNAERSAMLSFQEKTSTCEVYTKVFFIVRGVSELHLYKFVHVFLHLCSYLEIYLRAWFFQSSIILKTNFNFDFED